ncbi:MAG TPA: 2Fe-2S iron-sulfur cluster-binding protein [Acidimicrobiales bacterium]|nr:2Fe-2S iron-sulfur cluster-binding protein [Acidimicrobiales bacterium]
MRQLLLLVDGRSFEVADDGASLLEVLRDRLGFRTPKDGCSPQGQCGCCTVWVDGAPRVACVTPARRVAGRSVTTVDGLDPAVRDRWAGAFAAAGASQCGFCTPGIVMRLAGLEARHGRTPSSEEAASALIAHLCRCTGWRTILDACSLAAGDPDPWAGRDRVGAEARAALEGGVPQSVGPEVALGRGGFADDSAPDGALVAVPDGAGGWSVGETLSAARAAAGKVQGRRTTLEPTWPVEVPPGDWDLTLSTTWVEPAYLETDTSWCEPGGEPATPLGNGGAFGGKAGSPLPEAARRLSALHGRPVRVLWSREDVVRHGPKRPPIGAGVRADGTGVLRVARTPGVAEAVAAVAPSLVVEEVDVAGPATSCALRAAGWAEAAVLLAAVGARAAGTAGGPATVRSPTGAQATAVLGPEAIRIRVSCGDPLDEVVLRSYCVGAAHMALGWVRSEALAVDAEGAPHDLTVRSFGILRAREMPPVEVEIVAGDGPPVNGSDAVFAAVAAAAWLADGLPPRWPTDKGRAT